MRQSWQMDVEKAQRQLDLVRGSLSLWGLGEGKVVIYEARAEEK